MRGFSSDMARIIFTLLVIAIVFYFIITAEVKPSLDTYGNAQARLAAESIASSIDALTGIEEGSIKLDLDLVWDVSVKRKKTILGLFDDVGYIVIVSHEDSDGESEILTEVEEIELKDVGGVLNEKKDGVPMVDYSSKEPSGLPQQHSETIDIEDFGVFLKQTEPFDFDVMLEIKDKERSAIKAIGYAINDWRVRNSAQIM